MFPFPAGPVQVRVILEVFVNTEAGDRLRECQIDPL